MLRERAKVPLEIWRTGSPHRTVVGVRVYGILIRRFSGASPVKLPSRLPAPDPREHTTVQDPETL